VTIIKHVSNCRVGDIIRFKNKVSRLITRIDYNPHKSEPNAIRTVDLRDECRTRLNTYTALDPVIIEGTQGDLL
jgi:hypothetical protein